MSYPGTSDGLRLSVLVIIDITSPLTGAEAEGFPMVTLMPYCWVVYVVVRIVAEAGFINAALQEMDAGSSWPVGM